MRKMVTDKADDKDNIEIFANTNTLMSEMIINNNCEIDFRRYNSINMSHMI